MSQVIYGIAVTIVGSIGVLVLLSLSLTFLIKCFFKVVDAWCYVLDPDKYVQPPMAYHVLGCIYLVSATIIFWHLIDKGTDPLIIGIKRSLDRIE